MLIIPVSSLPVLFFFLVDMFRHLCDAVTNVWPDPSHQEVPYEYLSILEGANPTLELSGHFVKLSGEPESYRYDHLVTDCV